MSFPRKLLMIQLASEIHLFAVVFRQPHPDILGLLERVGLRGEVYLVEKNNS